MTKNYMTQINNFSDTTFGGELSLFDFEGHYTMTSMASKIAHDLRFDNACKANVKNRERNKNYKKGTK